MHRPNDAPRPTARRSVPVPVVHLLEGEAGDDPRRCLVWCVDGDVHVLVNRAHGREAYAHAGYHAERPFDGLAFECRIGEPCGYRSSESESGWGPSALVGGVGAD